MVRVNDTKMTVNPMKRNNRHSMTEKLKLLSVGACLLFLSACSELLITDAVSTVATDKTLGDHVVSTLSNKDCSSVRKELGMTYCKEDSHSVEDDPKLHCYNELGKVTCYKHADIYSIRSGVEDKSTTYPIQE